MALIGTMKYLTIGNQTYEIAGDELQIASASTLGGIKVGNGLSIDSTTGVLSASITETDPVFAASAAAGITAMNISNWNAKSDTDEKVKISHISTAKSYYLTFLDSSNTPVTKELNVNVNNLLFKIDSTTAQIILGGTSLKGVIQLNAGSSYKATLQPDTLTASRTYYLPDKQGTIALTSDIPTVPSSTGSATTGVTIADHSSTTIYGVQSSTTSVIGVSGSTTASKVTIGSSNTDYGITAAGSGSATLTFTMDTTDTKKLKVTFSHTHTAPTLGSKIPTVSASDVTVPKAASSATTVPIKNASTTTVITSKTHSVTDNGHTHTI